VGAFNVSNILAAVAATVVGLDIPDETAARGIVAMGCVPGRMERIDLEQDFTAIVDFAHTPNALQRALETVHQMTTGRVLAVFGSAGLRDRQKRRLMAEVSAKMADLTFLTAEDPRTEALDDILAEMASAIVQQCGVEGKTFWRVPDRGEAIRLAVQMAQPGDLVIACGKGHEQSMCFGAAEYVWDDRIAMQSALAERLGVPGPKMPYLPTQRT
jgi:UDP-N-acetylmuramoyl-L-alanyl-D-glutamate--2,6-diaminopimelate ligase